MNEEYAEFHNWLIAEKALSEKSANDVISRLRRANSIIDVDVPLDVETLLFHFMGQPAFKTLTQTVKSQLKRAIKLYKEFKTT